MTNLTICNDLSTIVNKSNTFPLKEIPNNTIYHLRLTITYIYWYKLQHFSYVVWQGDRSRRRGQSPYPAGSQYYRWSASRISGPPTRAAVEYVPHL